MVKVFIISILSLGMLGLTALIIFLMLPTAAPGSRWAVWATVALVVAMVVVSLISTPSLYRQSTELGDFLPLGVDGRPVSGSPAVQRLALALSAQLAGSPYHVLTAPKAARVEWNTGDIQYQSLLMPNRVKAFYRATLFENGFPGRFDRVDALQRYNSSLGRMEVSSSGGRVLRVERRVDVAITPQGLTKTVDYGLDTRVVDRAVKAACATLGVRAGFDVEAKIGIMWAVGSVAVAILVNFWVG